MNESQKCKRKKEKKQSERNCCWKSCLSHTPYRKRSPPLEEESFETGSEFWSAQTCLSFGKGRHVARKKAVTCHRHSKLLRATQPQLHREECQKGKRHKVKWQSERNCCGKS